MLVCYKKFLLIAVSSSLIPLALQAQEPPPGKPVSNAATKPAGGEAAKSQAKAEAPKAITDPIDRIKDEGLNRSQLMATLSYLTDVIGPRLTGSPNLKRANEWTCQTLTKWGLTNAHLEAWGPFGKGWTLKRFSAQVIEPQCIPLIAFPKAWSPSTEGPLAAQVIYFDVKTEADFARFKGKLKGAIVLTGPVSAIPSGFEPIASRITDKELLEMADADLPVPGRFGRGGPPADRNSNRDPNRDAPGPARLQVDQTPVHRRQMLRILRYRQPVRRVGLGHGATRSAPRGGRGGSWLVKNPSSWPMKVLRFLMDCSEKGEGGTVFVQEAEIPGVSRFPMPGQAQQGRRVSAWDKDAPKIPPQIVVAREHYNRLGRMIEQGEKIKMVVDIAAQVHDDDMMAYNTIAEIPGSDLKDEIVMLGGHLDSWHSGTGATDNAAGVATAMESVRILKALDLKPRRTIRIGLWTGEEQGLLGSRAFVRQHFGRTPRNPMAAMFGTPETSAEKKESGDGKPTASESKPEYVKFSGYFNLDNGTGKIRGVYLQGNEAVRPIFRKWLQPFRDDGRHDL